MHYSRCTNTHISQSSERQRDKLTIDQKYTIAPKWFQITIDAPLLTLQKRGDLICTLCELNEIRL